MGIDLRSFGVKMSIELGIMSQNMRIALRGQKLKMGRENLGLKRVL